LRNKFSKTNLMKKMFISLLGLSSLVIFAQNKPVSDSKNLAQDQQAIKAMCGCYQVEFNFAETFAYPAAAATYKASPLKQESALEWVTLTENTPQKISLQHLLIIGEGKNDVIKHWRQAWLYQNTDVYNFFKDQTWRYQSKKPQDVQGQWTQRVYQVDDSPRYEGSATWLHADGKSIWRNSTDAPLPRREYTQRQDYNVLKRLNHHEITPQGWLHDQDNQKIIRSDQGEDTLLANEKGHDVYTKVPDEKCIIAQNWWQENQGLWQKIRQVWDLKMAKKQDINLLKSGKNGPLYAQLFALKPDASTQEIENIIDSYWLKP
jgi:hypothetical protein